MIKMAHNMRQRSKLLETIASLLSLLFISQLILPSNQSIGNQFVSYRQLYSLRSYRDIQIFRYRIGDQVIAALWRFNATVDDSSILRHAVSKYGVEPRKSCDSLDITVFIRWKSIPTIDINNASIPENFVFEDREQYQISLKSDSILVNFNLSNPLPGDWYGLAYINQVDDRITQKGLKKECIHKLASSLTLSYSESDVISLAPSASLVQNITRSTYYKFFAVDSAISAKLIVSQCSSIPEQSVSQCPIVIKTRSHALPNQQFNDISLNCSHSYQIRDECQLKFPVSPNSWNYLQIEPFGIQYTLYVYAIEFKLDISFVESEDCPKHSQKLSSNSNAKLNLIDKHDSITNGNKNSYLIEKVNTSRNTSCSLNFVSLTRYDTVGTFDFKYIHVDATNFSENQDIFPFFDIPNDRQSMLAFDITQIDFGGSLAIEFAISPATNTSEQNVSISLCLQYENISLTNDYCVAEISSNTSSLDFIEGNSLKSIVIPYPRSGSWHISLRVVCYHIEFEQNEQEIVNIDCLSNTTSILLDIFGSPCLKGKCNDRGKCLQYLSGGILFSSCLCRAGWKGWICNDGSQAIPDDQLLLNFLLLTLSNIIFIPAVILATYNKHFTEALVYLTTMTSSTLYHACDSDYPQAYCVVNINILQFADFYSALLAFWVTLITLANIPDVIKTLFHMIGGIIIAFAVEYDRTSLWAFAIPSGIGGLIMLISWLCHCCCNKSCYPSSRLYLFSILPGVALTSGGLVVYAYFETQDNYAITHSCWHAIMALAVLFLIPTMKTHDDDDDSGKVIKHQNQNAKLAHVEWRPSQTFKFLADDIDML